MAIIAGIDGGGSKTEAMFFNTDSLATFRLSGEASRTSSVGWDESREVVAHLLAEGLTSFGVDAKTPISVSACLSGIDLPEQSRQMENELMSHFPASSIEVVNDSLAVLSAGTHGKPGTVLIAGTGSIALGEDAAGRIVRSGGFGYLIGDEGSGYDIGRKGMIAAIQSFEGRGPRTVLWERAARHFGVVHPNELIPRIYKSDYPIAPIALFAPVVIDAASHDETAHRIVSSAVRDYSAHIDSIHRQIPDVVGEKVVLAGGVFVRDAIMMDALRAARPDVDLHLLAEPPVIGALLRAIRKLAPHIEGGAEKWMSYTFDAS